MDAVVAAFLTAIAEGMQGYSWVHQWTEQVDILVKVLQELALHNQFGQPFVIHLVVGNLDDLNTFHDSSPVVPIQCYVYERS